MNSKWWHQLLLLCVLSLIGDSNSRFLLSLESRFVPFLFKLQTCKGCNVNFVCAASYWKFMCFPSVFPSPPLPFSASLYVVPISNWQQQTEPPISSLSSCSERSQALWQHRFVLTSHRWWRMRRPDAASPDSPFQTPSLRLKGAGTQTCSGTPLPGCDKWAGSWCELRWISLINWQIVNVTCKAVV